MAGDTHAAGSVTVGLTFEMDPRDKHEDDNRACVCPCVCLCAPTSSTIVIDGLVPVGVGRQSSAGNPCQQ